jgi:transketolase
MRFDPADPWHRGADRLVLSEGHAVPVVYAAYAALGGVVGRNRADARRLRPEDLQHLRELGSELDGHPNPAEGFPFFDAATGSLGMGLSVACGLRLAARLDGSERRIYCIVGDGESREGQIWEALDFAADQRLSGLCAIFNCNGQGQTGAVSPRQFPDVVAAKVAAFGWQCAQIDGHDPGQILEAFGEFHAAKQPFAIIARTVKGWGVDLMRDRNFHGTPLSSSQLPEALASLERQPRSATGPAAKPVPAAPRPAPPAPVRKPIEIGTIAECLESAGYGKALQARNLATRRAYGAALLSLGRASDRIVALDGDVSNSTFAELFAREFPERFFECRIAEQNMVSTAAGLAAGGRIPFVSSFAKFLARAYDQVELAQISRANVKLVGSHCGLGPSSDGPSQMALADVAFFNALANVQNDARQSACLVLQPADAVAACRFTALMANHDGMCYLRTHRPDVPFVYGLEEVFELCGARVLREGQGPAIVTCGFMVHAALQAADALRAQGLRCTVVDAYSLPLDERTITAAVEHGLPRVLVVEDNYAGGLHAAVAALAARRAGFQVEALCVRKIPKSARQPSELMEALGLGAAQIAERVRALQ